MPYTWLNLQSPDAAAQDHLLALIARLSDAHITCCATSGCSLTLDKTQLFLTLTASTFKPFTLDFNAEKHRRKISKNALKNSLLARACQAHLKPVVWDLTCGWGQDSFVLSSIPTTVISIEQHPIVGLMVRYAHWLLGAPQNWHIEINSAESALKTAQYPRPQVIYLDPMFPVKPKGRLSHKEMQILSTLCPSTLQKTEALLNLSLKQSGIERVVLKYPRKYNPPLKPHHIILGRTIQLCVYHPHGWLG